MESSVIENINGSGYMVDNLKSYTVYLFYSFFPQNIGKLRDFNQ